MDSAFKQILNTSLGLEGLPGPEKEVQRNIEIEFAYRELLKNCGVDLNKIGIGEWMK